MKALYRQVIDDPADAAAWRDLARDFARRGRVARAVACLDALEAASPAPAPGNSLELRRKAGREAIERRRALRSALPEGDAARVSVLLLGRAGAPETEQTRESIAAQTLGASACEIFVDGDPGAALARARGRYVACVDAGDELWPDHLEMLADHLDRTGRAMTYSQALRPGPRVTEAAPVLPREAVQAEFAPSSCVLVRRSALLGLGGFEPGLGRGQAWHLQRRLVDRLTADSVPVLSARLGDEDVSTERRFDLLLVERGALARARRLHRKGLRHLGRGDLRLAAQDFGRAWNHGLEVGPYVAAMARVAEHAPSLAGDLAALAGRELEPHVRGAFRKIARGAEARRQLAVRIHRNALRRRYGAAERRGRERARALGWVEAGAGF